MKNTKSIAEATNKFKKLEITLQEAGKLRKYCFIYLYSGY